MKKVRTLPKLVSHFQKEDANSLVFCEKTTGLAHFEAECAPSLDSHVERVASMLAMQCLVRGCEPCDYAILVPASQALTSRVTGRAKELLDLGMAAANPLPLSPRQQEILHAVVRNSANKEIAAKFNITVRTVKFHISALFNKFGVDNRAELARKATGVLRSQAALGGTSGPQEPVPRQRTLGPALEPFPSPLAHGTRTRNVRFAERVLSA
jgi:DNA-binding CsgD family transcriptional regulator